MCISLVPNRQLNNDPCKIERSWSNVLFRCSLQNEMLRMQGLLNKLVPYLHFAFKDPLENTIAAV